MTRKLVAFLTAATISMAAAAPAVHAMEMEFNMLTGAVFNSLRSHDLPTDGVDGLTLNLIGLINAIENDDSISGSSKKQQIEAVIRNQ